MVPSTHLTRHVNGKIQISRLNYSQSTTAVSHIPTDSLTAVCRISWFSIACRSHLPNFLLFHRLSLMSVAVCRSKDFGHKSWVLHCLCTQRAVIIGLSGPIIPRIGTSG